jgi:hypothetical protein
MRPSLPFLQERRFLSLGFIYNVCILRDTKVVQMYNITYIKVPLVLTIIWILYIIVQEVIGRHFYVNVDSINDMYHHVKWIDYQLFWKVRSYVCAGSNTQCNTKLWWYNLIGKKIHSQVWTKLIRTNKWFTEHSKI